jgi:hypothetical protein
VANCWLIGNSALDEHSSAACFARLRGLVPSSVADTQALPDRIREPTMIAISTSRLQTLSPDRRRDLANLVEEGAVLYVRGLPRSDTDLDLMPFAQANAAIAVEPRAVGYRFTASRMLPAVLVGEEASPGILEGGGARCLPAQAMPLVILRDVDGNERAATFALRHGNGCVIYDLHRENTRCAQQPLVHWLADPETRHREVGALVAADCVVHQDPNRLPPFNLTIDDRPISFDHFNAAAIRALLTNIDELCPGAHTDFAWTPRYHSPCRRYLGVMKQFATGFVWHGLWRHVDHRLIATPRADFARGRRLVSEVQQRFGVRLQPIMIFPFEWSAPAQFPLLMEAGFLGYVEEPHYPAGSHASVPRCLEFSLPFTAEPASGFTLLHRYSVAILTRDRMLAMAALGLPIIAYAHPAEILLRRFSCVWDRKGALTHFDTVLRFAASKRLPARSLEEIALEVNAANAGPHRADAALEDLADAE